MSLESLMSSSRKIFFSLREVASAQRLVAFLVGFLVGESVRLRRGAHECETKHEGGHTQGRHPGETRLAVTPHD